MKMRDLIISCSVAVSLSGAALASPPESNDPIKMMESSWSSITLQGHIAGMILQKLGYTVNYVPADDSARYPAFENGDLTFSMETWMTTQKQALETEVAAGKILDMGSLTAPSKEEWWYPSYMKEKCPGLPDWHALLEAKCAEAFSAPETAPKGRYLSGPADWGGHDEERVEALELPFEVVHAGSEASMFAELQSAYERKAPIMVWVYSPHWAPAKFQGEWVQFPEYEDACYSDPKWGTNPEKAFDCGKPHGWIKKMAWPGGEQKWPCAYQVIRAYDMDADTLDKLVIEVDLDGKKIDDVAKAWVDANEAKWKTWTACK
jgi:glycine betaine/proline transport system substrate-binding protein